MPMICVAPLPCACTACCPPEVVTPLAMAQAPRSAPPAPPPIQRARLEVPTETPHARAVALSNRLRDKVDELLAEGYTRREMRAALRGIDADLK